MAAAFGAGEEHPGYLKDICQQHSTSDLACQVNGSPYPS